MAALLKYWRPALGIAILIPCFFLGYSQGKGKVQGKWNKAQLIAAQALTEAREQASRDKATANQEILARAIERDTALSERNQLRAENDLLRNRKPIVQTIPSRTECHYPDVPRWLHDYNQSSRPLSLTGQTFTDRVSAIDTISPGI